MVAEGLAAGQKSPLNCRPVLMMDYGDPPRGLTRFVEVATRVSGVNSSLLFPFLSKTADDDQLCVDCIDL
jgi:hypothetical protein